MPPPAIVCCPNPASDALAAAPQGQPGVFRLALAGGSTPRRLYALLAQPQRRDRFAWDALHIYFGDERVVPKEDDSSNFRMASQAWLQHVPIPANQIWRIETERGAEQAAAAYGDALGDKPLNTVLLGMGGDGHTASLFPDQPITSDAAAIVTHSPAPPPVRVSLGYGTLNRADSAVLLVVGDGKAARLAQVHRQLALPPQERSLPAARIEPRASLWWLIDEAAASALAPEALLQARQRYAQWEDTLQ